MTILIKEPQVLTLHPSSCHSINWTLKCKPRCNSLQNEKSKYEHNANPIHLSSDKDIVYLRETKYVALNSHLSSLSSPDMILNVWYLDFSLKKKKKEKRCTPISLMMNSTVSEHAEYTNEDIKRLFLKVLQMLSKLSWRVSWGPVDA